MKNEKNKVKIKLTITLNLRTFKVIVVYFDQ